MSKRTFKEFSKSNEETASSKRQKTDKKATKVVKKEVEDLEVETPASESLQNLPIIKLEENKKHRVILWFRNDLRIHDNAVLNWALNQKAKQKEIIPVYCFDPRFYNRSVSKFKMNRKTGIIRTRF